MYFELIFTEECEWNCYYCVVPKLRTRYTFDISVLDKYKFVFDFVNEMKHTTDVILIEGGEIGLLNQSELKAIFSRFKHKVVVDTNGLFLERDYHKIFSDYISEIYFHVVENPAKLTKVKIYDSPVHINYGVVGYPQDLYNFIKFNDHIQFEYVDIEINDTNYNIVNDEGTIKKIADLSNVLCKDNVNSIVNRYPINTYQTLCRKFNASFVINFPRGIISICTTKGLNVGVPLNETNLLEVYHGCPIKDAPIEFCNRCYRTCAQIDIAKLLRRKKVCLTKI